MSNIRPSKSNKLLAAAAKALLDREDMDAEQIAHKAMSIAAEICVYTNNNFVTEVVGGDKKNESAEA